MNSAYIIDRVFNVHEVKENLNLIKILKCHIYIYIYIYIYMYVGREWNTLFVKIQNILQRW